MSQEFSVQPPRVATWLIGLFTSDSEAEAIPGDLLEEFSDLASKSGIIFARRWYWRQTAKTITHLAAAAFRSAPRLMASLVVGGFLLHGFLHALPDKALSVVTDRYLAFWSSHFQAYLWVLNGMMIAHLMASLLVGLYGGIGCEGERDGGHGDAGVDLLRDGWRCIGGRCIGMGSQASACGYCVAPMGMVGSVRDRDGRTHRANASSAAPRFLAEAARNDGRLKNQPRKRVARASLCSVTDQKTSGCFDENLWRSFCHSSVEKMRGPTSMRRGVILKTATRDQGRPSRMRRPFSFRSLTMLE